tara:strand:- start:1315 stop:2211 length:897 start_codon:yes stop_codon:yes gene_type:complete
MNKTQTVIHIGANKTASTLFQRQLFSKQDNILYLGEDCENYDDLKSLIHNIIHEDTYYYDKDLTISKFESLKNKKHTHIVFSNEDIMGSRNPSLSADRLKKVFPDAKVLMIIRNQLNVFPSWYINHGAYLKNVPKNYWRQYVDINSWLEYCFSFPTSSPVQAMNYYKYYEIYSRIFGEENIVVIPYEEIFYSRERFCSGLSSLIGVPYIEIEKVLKIKNERPRNTQLEYKIHKTFRLSKKLADKIYRLISRFDQSGPAQIKLSAQWQKKIYDEYARGNSLIEAKTGLDLSLFHYPLDK